ncbi:MAG: Gfo/Idh/MocA family oxidoreductase [Planctomycetes bacterium]|nr:Gfo/Idh/MocA family oxidoreductase [Planctomycetota bacterium]
MPEISVPKKFIQVGCGGFGGYWVSSVMPRLIDELKLAQAVAVADINPQTFPNAMAKYHLPPEKCYTDARRAFAENRADFAIVVVPPAVHETMVNLALEHDLHILSEKPIADTMEACCRICKKVTKAGKKMAVTMSHRFDQDKQSLERLIRSGEYGKLDYVIGRNTWTCRKYPTWGAFRYKIPDALLVEGTVHHFDIMRSLAGSNAKTVYAKTWNPPWGEFHGDSQALVTVEMENGVKVFYEGAKCNASCLNGWTQDYWRAECDKATLELDQRKLRVITGGLGVNATVAQKPLENQTVWTNPWLAELFVRWLHGGPPPINTLEDNIQCAALLFAAIESAHVGQVVDVQGFLRRNMEAVTG